MTTSNQILDMDRRSFVGVLFDFELFIVTCKMSLLGGSFKMKLPFFRYFLSKSITKGKLQTSVVCLVFSLTKHSDSTWCFFCWALSYHKNVFSPWLV